MSSRLVIHPAAAADLEEAFGWYEQRRAGLGDEFLSAVRSALDSVQSRPESFPVVYRGLRRVLTRRFPYAIFFRPAEEDSALMIVACFHSSRSPRRWRRRA